MALNMVILGMVIAKTYQKIIIVILNNLKQASFKGLKCMT